MSVHTYPRFLEAFVLFLNQRFLLQTSSIKGIRHPIIASVASHRSATRSNATVFTPFWKVRNQVAQHTLRALRARVKKILICRHICWGNREGGIEIIFTPELFLHPNYFYRPIFFTSDFLRPLFFTTTIFLPSSLYFDPTETLVRAFH